MTPDPREKCLVSWAADTITALRSRLKDAERRLNEHAAEHAGSEVAVRYLGCDVKEATTTTTRSTSSACRRIAWRAE
jgi:hypothetical protein